MSKYMLYLHKILGVESAGAIDHDGITPSNKKWNILSELLSYNNL